MGTGEFRGSEYGVFATGRLHAQRKGAAAGSASRAPSARGLRSAPKRARFISPGHRPGKRSTEPTEPCKGETTSAHLVAPLQGFDVVVPFTPGDARG